MFCVQKLFDYHYQGVITIVQKMAVARRPLTNNNGGQMLGRRSQSTLLRSSLFIAAMTTACVSVLSTLFLGTSLHGSYFKSLSKEYGEHSPRRVAVVNFVGGMDQIYGVYSIQQQMLKHNMTAAHIVLAPDSLDQNLKDVIALWLGDKNNLRVVNETAIMSKIADDSGIWKGVFNKLWAFNLTEFEKIIVLDSDVLIRTDISHWADYPTPCAIQAKDDLDWNSGAMVITPDTKLFEEMLSLLPNLKKFDSTKTYHKDPIMSSYHDQGFITAFFTKVRKNATNEKRCVMPTESAVLSSSLTNPIHAYYSTFHPWIYETIHFTTDKPWRGNTAPDHWFVCKMLREWNETMLGIEKYYHLVEPLKNDYLRNCNGTHI